jgi:hypothetical protein
MTNNFVARKKKKKKKKAEIGKSEFIWPRSTQSKPAVSADKGPTGSLGASAFADS